MKQAITLLFLFIHVIAYSQTTFKDSELLFKPDSFSQSFILFFVDQDQLVDLVVVVRWGDNQRVIWKKNLGEGRFSDEITISNSIYQPQYLAAGDIDNDGLDDLLVTALRGKFYLFKNNGNGSFTDVFEMNLVKSHNAFLKDIDHDGFDDMIYWSYAEDLMGYFLNDKNGGFGEKVIVLDNLNKIVDIDLKDYDNDGDDDFVIISNLPGKLVVVENMGNLSFSNPNYKDYSGRQPQEVEFADLNENGFYDIVVTSSSGGDVSIFPNDTKGDFNEQLKISTVKWANRLTIDDVDFDGDNDVLIGQSYGSAAIIYNEGNLNFSEPDFSIYVVPNTDNKYKNNYGAESIYSVDVDGDCDQDIITLEESLFLFINQKQDKCDGTNSKTTEPLELNVSTYPNPTSDILHIEVNNSQNFQANVFSLKGEFLLSKDNPSKIDLLDFVSGTYILQIKDIDSRITAASKFVFIK